MRETKPITVSQAGRRGARAVLRKYGRAQLREWGKLGGRPKMLDETKENSRVRTGRASRSEREDFAE